MSDEPTPAPFASYPCSLGTVLDHGDDGTIYRIATPSGQVIGIRTMRLVTILLLVLLAGCTTAGDHEAFYVSALTQEAWFALQAEPAADAWKDFEAVLAQVPAEIRSAVRKTSIKEAKARAAKN